MGALRSELDHDNGLRRRKRRIRPLKLSLSMAPMIDVVFLLLIYFMVATDFQIGESAFRVETPQTAAAAADPFTLDEEPLRIHVTSTGLSADMYRLRVEGPHPQSANVAELAEWLRVKQVNEANITAGGGVLFAPDHPIIIHPTARTRWEHAIEVLNAATRAQYTNVTFAKPN